MKQSICCLNYYESRDFKSYYKEAVCEDFWTNEGDITRRIKDLFNLQNYETEKYLKNWFKLWEGEEQLIYDFIKENREDFIKEFRSIYVGYTSLCSVAYSEQEEQILPEEKDEFEEAGYVVHGNPTDSFFYAYYVLSGGFHIDLLANIELLDNFLLTIKK